MNMDMRELSRSRWTSSGSSLDHINCGSLLRIADATELMAKNYQELINDRDRFKRWYNDEQTRRYRLERRIASLRGVITRMKRNSLKEKING